MALSRQARFFRTSLLAVSFAFAAVVFGAYIRLSETGIGCPDGPACTTQPVAPATVQAAAEKRPSHSRAWKDMTTRYIAGGLGIFLIQLATLGWQLRHRPNQQVVIPVLTLVLVFGLTAIGVFTVDLHSKPAVMMIQILGALVVLVLLWWIVLREQRIFRSVTATPLTRSLRLRTLFAIVLTLLASTLGAWSMVNYAGGACPDFPMCRGEYWPVTSFGVLLEWTADGLAYDRTALDLAAAIDLQFAHRLTALAATLYTAWLSLRLLRVGLQDSICRYGLLLLVMLSFALAFGIMQAVGGMTLVLGVAHSAASTLLLLTLVTLYHVVRAPRVAST